MKHRDRLMMLYRDFLFRQPTRWGIDPEEALERLCEIMQWSRNDAMASCSGDLPDPLATDRPRSTTQSGRQTPGPNGAAMNAGRVSASEE
ncbi:hypothetical protein [Paludibacterium paludis]|uniref:Uncharacterized protein n=1 Tax=Paludibacterium paludis TaxID=1225769 RepID=A0A918U714_9NEIS|nr:hypothetical protein [Paludibacterium paludis]GGY02710.1 hypothetical protein GCM10011289_01060 [Paludibacterium paludis]